MENRLRVRRAELDISQDDTAIKAGLKRDRYWRIEKGYAEPSDTEQMQIALALVTTTDKLFFPEEAETDQAKNAGGLA